MTPRNDSDSSLVQRMQAGDQAALADFIRVHERSVVTLASRILDDDQDVIETTQDTFLRVWRNIATFRGDSAVSTWLHRIAVNEALMRARRKRRSHTTLDAADATSSTHNVDSSAEGAARGARVRAVRDALATLPVDQRAAVVLRDIEGYSGAEAAEMLGVAEPALKTRLHRGRMRLRLLLVDVHRESD